jgi:hypothetical protein
MTDPIDPDRSLAPFISDALRVPPPALVYETSRRVASLHPGRVLETTDWRFGLDSFAAAGRCAVRPAGGVHAQCDTGFRGADAPLYEDIENGWLEVEWEGRRLEVLRMSWLAEGHAHFVSWIMGAERALVEAFFRAVCAWNAEVRPSQEVLVFEGGRFKKSASLHEAIARASFDELVLPPALRAQIRADFAQFFEARPLYQRYGVAWRRGVLFTGPPGNGKTHTIKALVNALGKPCVYVRSFENPCGDEQASIRAIFARARETAPCLLVLEDLDALVNDKNRSFFLNELDGFAQNEGIVTLATTNHEEKLDPAIAERPSRFDRKYRFDLPDDAGRAAYLALFCHPFEPDMRPSDAGLARIAELTSGFSYAYLKELLVSAMIRWLGEMRPGAMDAAMDAEAEALRAQIGSRLSADRGS